MKTDRLISKINAEINGFNESGGREDRACAEGLRRARTLIQIEILKKLILTKNQQIVLDWLKEEKRKNPDLTVFGTLSVMFDESENRFMNLDAIDSLNALSDAEQAQVLQAFSQWVLEREVAE